MRLLKNVFDIFIFSTVQTLLMPFFLLPYGMLILPYLILASFLSLFVPILVIGIIQKFAFKKVSKEKKLNFFSTFFALTFLCISVFFIQQRGTSEYFGKNVISYIQITVAAILGFFSWKFLSNNVLEDMENRG